MFVLYDLVAVDFWDDLNSVFELFVNAYISLTISMLNVSDIDRYILVSSIY